MSRLYAAYTPRKKYIKSMILSPDNVYLKDSHVHLIVDMTHGTSYFPSTKKKTDFDTSNLPPDVCKDMKECIAIIIADRDEEIKIYKKEKDSSFFLNLCGLRKIDILALGTLFGKQFFKSINFSKPY